MYYNIGMSSLISDPNLVRIRVFRKYFFRVAVWTLIAGVVMVVVSVFASRTLEWDTTLLKITFTLFALALAMLVSVNSLRLLDDQRLPIQIFAIGTMICTALWVILWLMTTWCPAVYRQGAEIHKAVRIMMYFAIYGFAILNLWHMYEGKRIDLVRPLKAVITVLITYLVAYNTMTLLTDSLRGEMAEKLAILANLAVLLGLLLFVIAWVISRTERGRTKAMRVKSNDELRFEIEDRLRRESIEQEVREKLAAEKKARSKQSEKSEQVAAAETSAQEKNPKQEVGSSEMHEELGEFSDEPFEPSESVKEQ